MELTTIDAVAMSPGTPPGTRNTRFGTPVMRTWNIVRLQSKLLSPAAEAFRYFIIERGEAHLQEHDRALLAA